MPGDCRSLSQAQRKADPAPPKIYLKLGQLDRERSEAANAAVRAIDARLEHSRQFHWKIWAEIEEHFRFKTSEFNYTSLHRDGVFHTEIFHAVGVGWNGWVAVIGDGANGSYEWVIRHDAETDPQTGPPRYEHSDQAWGSPESALREALLRVDD